jgi:hypothetical protein
MFSCYISFPVPDGCDFNDVAFDSADHHCPDLQLIRDSSYLGVLGSIEHTLMGAGACSWLGLIRDGRIANWSRLVRSGDLDVSRLSIPVDSLGLPLIINACVYTSDAGSDQAKARRVLAMMFSECPQTFFLDSDCLMHNCHLQVQGGLSIADILLESFEISWKYFGTLAQITHCWRNAATPLYKHWQIAHGSPPGSISRMCPKCLSGRWCSVSACETAHLGAFFAEQRHVAFRDALSHVLSKRVALHNDVSKPKETAASDEPSVQESQAYTERLNKWSSRAVQAVHSPAWWLVLRIVHRARGAQDHFLNWLQKPIVTVGDVHSRTHLSMLVAGKGLEFASELEQLCVPAAWSDVLLHAASSGLDGVTVAEGIVLTLLHNVAQFDMRIVRRLSRWPYKLLLFAEDDAETPSDRRKELASELLSASPSRLEINALKFKCLFSTALTEASQTGLLAKDVLLFLRTLRYSWTCSTQDVEGRNSIVKIMSDRCPAAGVDLVSERLRIKASLGLGHRGAATSWSAVKPLAEDLVNTASNYFDAGLAIFNEGGRWVAPTSPAVPAQLSYLRSNPNVI